MMLGKKEYKDINRQTLDALFTPIDGNIPMLSDMAAVFVWLCSALGMNCLLSGLPFDVPYAAADIIALGVTLPLGVGVFRYMTRTEERSASAVFEPFESARAYTDAWKSALTLPLYIFKRPKLIGFYLRAMWHLIPIVLSGGLWLFGLIPYIAAVTGIIGKSENVNKTNNKNTNGESNQWIQTRANSI